MHVERVKSYAPHVYHYVFDLRVDAPGPPHAPQPQQQLQQQLQLHHHQIPFQGPAQGQVQGWMPM